MKGAGLPALDGLRAISIGLVLATHMLPLGPKGLRFNEMTGAMGMSLFFSLSGYLIMTTLRSDPVRDFVVKRLARILPLLALYLLIVSVIVGQNAEQAVAVLGFYLNYRQDLVTPVTAHLWSLCVEMHFYLAIALLAAANRICLYLVWPCCLAVTLTRMMAGAYIDIPTHLRVDEILAGACVAMLQRPSAMSGSNASGLWIAAAAASTAASHPDAGWLQYLRPYAAGALLYASLALAGGWIHRCLTSAALRYVAGISYALYVIHPLTIAGWWNEGSSMERYLFKRPVSFAVVFALAHLSTRYWEQPWSLATRRWLAMRHQSEKRVLKRS